MKNTIIDPAKAKKVNAILLDWYTLNRRALPFRETKSPYKIWISEIMAQQTQMKTLIPYYNRFIQRFPEVSELAQASLDEVYEYWEGLGYYSRAKNIKRAAEIIDRKGFPKTYKELLNLPGVGPYTAGAIASIAYGERVPAVDANVTRVIARIYGSHLNYSLGKSQRVLFEELKETMPKDSGTYNQSLMDFGALVCLPKNPNCESCPLQSLCLALKKQETDTIPVRGRQHEKKVVHNEALIIAREFRPLFIKRGPKGLLANLYGFPMADSTEIRGETARELAQKYNTSDPEYLGRSKHEFSHVIWETDVFYCVEEKKTEPLTDKPTSIPTAFKKMLLLL